MHFTDTCFCDLLNLSDVSDFVGDTKITTCTFWYTLKLFDLAGTNFRDLQRFWIELNLFFAGIKFVKEKKNNVVH